MIRRLARRGWRQLSLLCAILLVFCLLADRLYTLQVGVRAQDRLQLEKWYTADVAAPQVEKPPRGTIVDVNGSSLVSTVTVYKLAAAPALVLKSAKAPVVARLLTDVLFPVRLPGGQYAHDPKRIQKALDAYTAHYEEFLAALKSSWNYVCLAGDESYTCPYKSNLTQGLLNTLLGRLAKLGVAGISEEPRSLPSYPNGRLASQVLGYVDYQYPGPVDTGQYGVQQYYNNLLAGTPGHTTVRFDTKGNPIRVGTGNDAAPQAGATLRLTLDSYVQYLVEQDLTRVVKAQHATGGSIVVERPGDGAIVAMASTPSYDPNTWRALVALKAKQAGAGGKKYNQTAFMQSLYQLFPNPAVSKRYEPGSTFKAFTIATGFDAGLFNENTRVNGPSFLPVDGITITNWCGTQCTFFGPETPSMMLHYSSNIGAAQFSRIIPPTTWYQYIMNNFDFSRPAGIDLAGEVGGDIRWPNDKPPKLVWVPAYKDTQAYGQGLSITPLQLTNGYAALANGGMLPTPHLLASYTLAGKTVTPAWPPIQRAISSQTSERMRKLLVSQAIGGEACKALVPGYDIAAKTGTASIPAAGGNYYPNTTIASTVAFGPVDAPIGQQYVVLVKVDKPAVQWGSEVAAPVVNDIFQHLFQYYKIMPAANPVQPKNGICHEVNSSQLDPWPPKP